MIQLHHQNSYRLLLKIGLMLSVSLLSSNCGQQESVIPPARAFEIQQNWELKPGNLVAGHRISGGLGDISIEMNGDSLYAPFSGTLHPHQQHCAIFSSPEVPAYLLRFCDIKRPKLGELQQGEPMGTGRTLQFATLRKQPSGEWAIVEPAQDMLERILASSL